MKVWVLVICQAYYLGICAAYEKIEFHSKEECMEVRKQIQEGRKPEMSYCMEQAK